MGGLSKDKAGEGVPCYMIDVWLLPYVKVKPVLKKPCKILLNGNNKSVLD